MQPRLQQRDILLLIESCRDSIAEHEARRDAAVERGDNHRAAVSSRFIEEYTTVKERLMVQLEAAVLLDWPTNPTARSATEPKNYDKNELP
jgi:hypothetical protein